MREPKKNKFQFNLLQPNLFIFINSQEEIKWDEILVRATKSFASELSWARMNSGLWAGAERRVEPSWQAVPVRRRHLRAFALLFVFFLYIWLCTRVESSALTSLPTACPTPPHIAVRRLALVAIKKALNKQETWDERNLLTKRNEMNGKGINSSSNNNTCSWIVWTAK